MRLRPSILALLLALPAAASAHDQLTRKDIEGDLVLEARLATPKQVQPGERIAIEARIENTSTTHTYKLVRPGDGSESGWREPHVFLTGELRGEDGKWRKVAERGLMRCGNYDADWHDEVFELKAGAKTEFGHWFALPDMALDLSRPGVYRITAHYRYSAKPPSRESLSPTVPPSGLGRMKGVPKFELTSKPVELVVARDLDVHVKVIGRLKSKTPTLLSELVEVKVSNETQGTLTFRPDAWAAYPQFKAGGTRSEALLRKPAVGETTLRADETIAVLGKGRLARGLDYRVTTDAAKGFVELAIVFGRAAGGGARYTSEIVKVPIGD